jgi:hypothetical protein
MKRGIIGLIALVLILGTCCVFLAGNKSQPNEVIIKEDTSLIRAQIADSVRTVEYQRTIAKLDSVTQLKDKRITALQVENRQLRTKLDERVKEYTADITVQTPECDTIIEVTYQLVDSLVTETAQLTEIAYNYKDMFTKADSAFNEQYQSLNNAYAHIETIKAQQAKQNTWYRRNEKWIFLSVGVAGTFLITHK